MVKKTYNILFVVLFLAALVIPLALTRWESGGVSQDENRTLAQFPALTLEGTHSFRLQPGCYRLAVTTRQIDGTASVALCHLDMDRDRTLTVTPPEDQTAQRLQQVPLALPKGPLAQLLRRDPSRRTLLIFADPGSEPTEHLLVEMLECADGFRDLSCRILLLTGTAVALSHPTVRRLQGALPEMESRSLRDPDALAALYRQMQIGDLRLPFTVCIDSLGRGAYADANYRIRQAQTLLDVLRLL